MDLPKVAVLCVVLAGCMANPNGSEQMIDGRRFVIERNDDYFWPDSMTGQNPDGTVLAIDVFPIVTALVVSAPGGPPIERADETAAYAAVQAHCHTRGLTPPGPYSRFDGNTWAFSDCRPA